MDKQVDQIAKGKNINQLLINNFKVISAAAVLLVFFFYLIFANRNSIQNYLHDLQVSFNSIDTTKLKILLCPLSNQPSAYEDLLYKKLVDLENNDTFNISVERLRYHSPLTNDDAKDIAKRKSGDIAIGGRYHNWGEGKFRVDLRYSIVSDILLASRKEDVEIELVLDYEKKNLTQGAIPYEMTEAINWISGIFAYNAGNIKLASHHFKEVDISALYEEKSVDLLSQMAIILLDLNNVKVAHTIQWKVIKLLESELSLNQDKFQLAKSYSNYAQILGRIGEPDSVKFYAGKSLHLLDGLRLAKALELKAVNLSLLSKIINKGVIENHDYYCELAREGLEIIQNQDSLTSLIISTTYSNNSICFRLLQKMDSALILQRKAIDVTLNNHPIDYLRLADYYNNYSVILEDYGRPLEAFHYIDTALQISERFLSNDSHRLGNQYSNAASFLYQSKRYDEALKYVNSAIRIAELPQNVDGEGERLYKYYNNKAIILEESGSMVESIFWHKKAKKQLESTYKIDFHPIMENNFANAYINIGKKTANISFLDTALYILENALIKTSKADTKAIAVILHSVSRSYFFRYKIDNEQLSALTKAKELIDESIALKRNLVDSYPEVSYALRTKIEYFMDDAKTAKESVLNALHVLKKMHPGGHLQIDTINYYLHLIERKIETKS